ncbi:MAG: hypothetical protein LC799_08475 [Actinobacteria bacterium]|nr:hypothetical protein [Actinomycetota bacterium]
MTGRAGLRWVLADDLAHVLTDDTPAGNGMPAVHTLCGLSLPTTLSVYTGPPSLNVCRGCVPLPGDDKPPPPGDPDVPPPVFGTPTTFQAPAGQRFEPGAACSELPRRVLADAPADRPAPPSPTTQERQTVGRAESVQRTETQKGKSARQ